MPPVEAVAQSFTVAVFLLSKTWWPFKHNDAYWDDAVLEVVDEPEPPVELGRGQPRIQYKRKYILLPQAISRKRALEILDLYFDEKCTTGYSADDGGIGDLDEREIVGHDFSFLSAAQHAEFFAQFYPGVKSVFKDAPLSEPDDSVTKVEPGMHDDGGGDWMLER